MRDKNIIDKNVSRLHTNAYFKNMAGVTKTGGKLTKMLLDERSKDELMEDKRRNSA